MNESTATIAVEQWQIRFHETMAALLRAKEAFKKQFGLVGLLNGLWKSSRDLKSLTASLRTISEMPDGALPEGTLQSLIPQLRKLIGSIDDLMDTAKRRNLLNQTLTASPLNQIRDRGEYVADFLDTLEMSIDPETIAAIDEGRSQIERGEFVDMERIS